MKQIKHYKHYHKSIIINALFADYFSHDVSAYQQAICTFFYYLGKNFLIDKYVWGKT